MNISMIILLLAFLIDIQGAIANDKISLAYMVPDSWILSIKAWDSALLYCGTSLIGLLAAPAAFTRRVIPAAKIAAMFLFAVVLTMFLAISSVRAADNLPVKTPAATTMPTGCSASSCSGWYAGIGLTGNGTNADIVGNGINQSVFAAGGIIDAHGGYQLWNGSYLGALEVGIGNQFQNGPINQIGAQSLVGYEIVKLGGSLAGLINFSSKDGTTAPGQAEGPINVPASLANMLIAPYIAIGAVQRNGYSQWVTGAGAEFVLAANYNLDIRYLYAPSQDTLAAMNMVTIGVNYHFGAK